MAKAKKEVTEEDQPIIEDYWLKFISNVKPLLGPQADNRPLDQFLPLRDKVLSMVTARKFLDELNRLEHEAPTFFPNSPDDWRKVINALKEEMEAFSRAREVAEATKPTKKKARKKWWSRWRPKLLGWGSTVTGSAKDILAENSAILKSGFTLMEEVFDIFKE